MSWNRPNFAQDIYTARQRQVPGFSQILILGFRYRFKSVLLVLDYGIGRRDRNNTTDN